MKTASKISTIVAAMLLASAPAIAQDASGADAAGGNTTVLDNVPTPGNPVSGTNAEMMMSEGAYGVFWDTDADGWRSADDARMMYDEASDDDRAIVDMACTDWQEEEVAFLDSVSSTCRSFTEEPAN